MPICMRIMHHTRPRRIRRRLHTRRLARRFAQNNPTSVHDTRGDRGIIRRHPRLAQGIEAIEAPDACESYVVFDGYTLALE